MGNVREEVDDMERRFGEIIDAFPWWIRWYYRRKARRLFPRMRRELHDLEMMHLAEALIVELSDD